MSASVHASRGEGGGAYAVLKCLPPAFSHIPMCRCSPTVSLKRSQQSSAQTDAGLDSASPNGAVSSTLSLVSVGCIIIVEAPSERSMLALAAVLFRCCSRRFPSLLLGLDSLSARPPAIGWPGAPPFLPVVVLRK